MLLLLLRREVYGSCHRRRRLLVLMMLRLEVMIGVKVMVGRRMGVLVVGLVGGGGVVQVLPCGRSRGGWG
jgi:hypothetical protein